MTGFLADLLAVAVVATAVIALIVWSDDRSATVPERTNR